MGQALGPNPLWVGQDPMVGHSPGDPTERLVGVFLGRQRSGCFFLVLHSSPVRGRQAGMSPAIKAGLRAQAVVLVGKTTHLNTEFL